MILRPIIFTWERETPLITNYPPIKIEARWGRSVSAVKR